MYMSYIYHSFWVEELFFLFPRRNTSLPPAAVSVTQLKSREEIPLYLVSNYLAAIEQIFFLVVINGQSRNPSWAEWFRNTSGWRPGGVNDRSTN
jgi:hypothetical protein